jgi:hypothetical protein
MQVGKIQMGTVISGTLRNEDLLNAFIDELETLVKHEQKTLRLKTPLGIAYGDWTSIIARKRLIFDARNSQDESIASEIVNELQDALNEYAPDGMYFGTLEGDGADFGWWNIESEVRV